MAKEKKGKTVCLYLDHEVDKHISRWAQEENVSKSEIANNLLNTAINQELDEMVETPEQRS